MGQEDKIIGMYGRNADMMPVGEQPPLADYVRPDAARHTENPQDCAVETAMEAPVETQGNEDDFLSDADGDEAEGGRILLWTAGLLIIAALGWTGFFIWSQLDVSIAFDDPAALPAMVSQWAVPMLLLATFWLIVQRSSRAEARRFGDAARLLHNESTALAVRLRLVNGELKKSRAFLAEQARTLESLGRESAENMAVQARAIEAAFATSEGKARILEEVSNAATGNLEQLSRQLPVVTNSAKDVTNQIGNAGRTAHGQLAQLIAAMKESVATGGAMREQLAALGQESESRVAALASAQAQMAQELQSLLSAAEGRSSALVAHFAGGAADLTARLEQAGTSLSQATAHCSDSLAAQMAGLEEALARFAHASGDEQRQLQALFAEMEDHRTKAVDGLAELDQNVADIAARMVALLAEARGGSDDLAGSLTENGRLAAGLVEGVDVLEKALEAQQDRLARQMPATLSALEQALNGALSLLDMQSGKLAAMNRDGAALAGHIGEVENRLAGQATMLDEMLAHGESGLQAQLERIGALQAALAEAKTATDQALNGAEQAVAHAVETVDRATGEAAGLARSRFDTVVTTTIGEMNQLVEETLSSIIEERVRHASSRLDAALSETLAASNENTQLLEGRLVRLAEMAGSLEARIADAQGQFDGVGEDGFARRMALLTESLNSAAIDIAKILSTDVTDTAWSAYLKGDRGIFTRRAVRLLDNADAKLIADHYDGDSEFRSQVNRYIHDFEAMMRNLLSTRDGHAVSVTLLSSDVGKLYVALAQAIERLRN